MQRWDGVEKPKLRKRLALFTGLTRKAAPCNMNVL